MIDNPFHVWRTLLTKMIERILASSSRYAIISEYLEPKQKMRSTGRCIAFVVRECIRDVWVAPCLDMCMWALACYSSLSQFRIICFMFERVMSCPTNSWKRSWILDPLPSNWFPVEQVVVWCNERMGTNFWRKLTSCCFTPWELQEQLTQNDCFIW